MGNTGPSSHGTAAAARAETRVVSPSPFISVISTRSLLADEFVTPDLDLFHWKKRDDVILRVRTVDWDLKTWKSCSNSHWRKWVRSQKEMTNQRIAVCRSSEERGDSAFCLTSALQPGRWGHRAAVALDRKTKDSRWCRTWVQRLARTCPWWRVRRGWCPGKI